jgi:hypothetical protein
VERPLHRAAADPGCRVCHRVTPPPRRSQHCHSQPAMLLVLQLFTVANQTTQCKEWKPAGMGCPYSQHRQQQQRQLVPCSRRQYGVTPAAVSSGDVCITSCPRLWCQLHPGLLAEVAAPGVAATCTASAVESKTRCPAGHAAVSQGVWGSGPLEQWQCWRWLR